MTFQDWIAVGQLAAAPAMALAAYYLRGLGEGVKNVETRVGGVERQLRELNGRMVTIETWRTMHERSDELADKRHERALTDIRDEIRALRGDA